MLLSSCDVHEFPDPLPAQTQFVLHLNYDTELPLYKVVTYHNESRAAATGDVDIRYIVSVYPAEEESKTSERNELYRFVFSKDDISTLDHSVEFTLDRGNYNFVVWSDYVTSSVDDLYYDTSTFEEITLRGDKHEGCNDYRDAFVGTITAEVSTQNAEATVDMHRPMAKFNFISDDVSEFVSTVQNIRAEKAKQSRSDAGNATEEADASASNDIQFSDFDIVFRYNGFMPNVFNTFSNKPSNSTPGISFTSKINILESGEAELGFDYVFVNGSESMVSVSVEVYDRDGELISRFKPVDVPLVRSKLTTIKANILTYGDSGVAIIPDFDSEYNYTFE